MTRAHRNALLALAAAATFAAALSEPGLLTIAALLLWAAAGMRRGR